jgi:hypothetical protein
MGSVFDAINPKGAFGISSKEQAEHEVPMLESCFVPSGTAGH